MLCGSFSHVDDDFLGSPRSPAHRRSRKKEKNPYANRGLEKFRTVMEDLQARREKIMAQLGAGDPFLIRFAHSNLRDWVPIIIRLRDPRRKIPDRRNHRPALQSSRSPPPPAPPAEAKVAERTKNIDWVVPSLQRHPRCGRPALILLVLVCLVLFGRSFAIMCASVCWYMAPVNWKSEDRREDPKRCANRRTGRRLMYGSLERT